MSIAHPVLFGIKSAEATAKNAIPDAAGAASASADAANVQHVGAIVDSTIGAMQPAATDNLISTLDSTKIFGE